jgi:hypothetical protein
MIKIEAEKILKNGNPAFLITKIEALTKEDLPREYLQGHPACFYDPIEQRLAVSKSEGYFPFYQLVVGKIIPKDRFEELMAKIDFCGARLMDINKRRRESWHGSVVIKI